MKLQTLLTSRKPFPKFPPILAALESCLASNRPTLMLLFCLLFGLEFGSLGIAGSPQDTHVGGRRNVSYSLGAFLFTLLAVKKLTVSLKKKKNLRCFLTGNFLWSHGKKAEDLEPAALKKNLSSNCCVAEREPCVSCIQGVNFSVLPSYIAVMC